MKKTFAMMLALIMVFAAFMATVGTVSAADAEEGFMVATLNDITFDGDLTITKGKGHEVESSSSGVIKTMGTPHLSEYALDVTLENAWIGAAYSMSMGELYLGVFSLEEVYEMEITVGGAEYTVDAAGGYVEGGEGYGQVVASNSAYTYEIILPLEEIEIKEIDRGLASDITITVVTSTEDTFDGTLFYSKYAAGYTYNALHKMSSPIFSANSTDNGDGTFTIVNDGTNAREYAPSNGVPNLTKNLVYKMDITVDSMPFTNVEDTVGDAPDHWGQTAAARVWLALKYRWAETLYMNIQNTADDGIVLNVFEHSDINGTVTKEQHTIVLGKETGEAMVLELEWSEADEDGKSPLNVYVDGKLVGTVESSMNINKGLGVASGALQFNAQWTKADSSNETIDVTFGNISINEISPLYSDAAYKAMASGQFGDIVDTEGEGEGEGEGTTDGDATTDDTDKAPETEDKSDAAASDTTSDTTEEKKGCGSSIAGFGLVAVLGTALTAVVASKKKED